MADVLFGVLYEEGRTYTIGQITAWMEDAGLAQVSVFEGDQYLRFRYP